MYTVRRGIKKEELIYDRALVRPKLNIIVKSDASLTDWDAVCQNKKTGGLPMANERTQHIDVLEIKAALLAIQNFQSITTRKHV